MSTSGYAARVGAAAFLLGISLGAPVLGPLPVAAADSRDTSVSNATDPAGTAPANRTARGPRAATRNAARPAASETRRDSRPAAALRSSRAQMAPTQVDPAQVAPAEVAAAPVGPEPTSTPSAPAKTAAPASVVAGPSSNSALRTEQAPTLRAVTAAAPAPLAAASTPGGAAATGMLNGLFGFRSIVEGAGASLRRGFFNFNKAPTANPVQLTGQVDGPITGTLGAVNPRGGTLTYAVTGDPRYGAVAITPDGGYTYTPGIDFAGSDSFVVTVTATGRLSLLRRPKSTQASVSVSQGALAPLLQFQFVYGSGSQYWSPEARSSLEAAARQLSSYLVVTSPVTITYAVTGERKPLSGTLASAGSDFVDFGDGFKQTVVQSKIQTGVDANGADPDGDISWNFGPSWGFGSSVSNTDYDFESTAMHELTHTLGFLSYVDKAGNNYGKTWTVFDSFLVDAQGNRAINSDYVWNTDYNTNLTGGSGGLYFGGPNAVAAYNGPVPLYTPFPWSAGSSISHLDDKTFTGSNQKLMNAVSSSGLGFRSLSPAELGVLADIGYQVNTGSQTPTLMFVGFFLSRRMRRRN